MSDKCPKLTVVEKDSKEEIQGVEESTATLLREWGSPSLSGWSAQGKQWWSPAPRYQHSPHWGFPNTNLPPQRIQGTLHQLPKTLPHLLKLSKAECSKGRTHCQGGNVLQKTTIFNKTLGATISNGPETLHCGTAGIWTLLFLPTHIYKPLENTKHTIKCLLSPHPYITTIHLPVFFF